MPKTKDPTRRPGKMPQDIYYRVLGAVLNEHPESRIGSIVRRKAGRVLVLSVSGAILLETDYKKARAHL